MASPGAVAEVQASGVSEWVFAADDPVAAGHFPGDPIIPGALVLEAVVRVLGAAGARLEIRYAKFLGPVRPGDRLRIRWESVPGGEIRFDGAAGVSEQPVVTGLLRLRPGE